MARKIRGCFAGRLVEVTTRTFQSRFLLRPGSLANRIIKGVIARAQQRTGMEIVAPETMSNHEHLLLRPQSTKQLSEFMRYVNSNVARKIGRLYGWKGKFWDKRYSAIIVSDEEEAQVGRLKYLLSQGVKEGLVERPEDWPGLHPAAALMNGYDSISGGIWHDRTAQYRAKCRAEYRAKKSRAKKTHGAHRKRGADYVEKNLRIELSPLPCWEHLSWRQRRDAVRQLIHEIVEEAKLARGDRPVVGAEAVLQQDPLAAPETSAQRPAPLCHAASRRARAAIVRQLLEFSVAFRQAAEALRQGLEASFPEGCFPPGLPYVAESTVPDG